jgi:DinB family protein
MTTSIPHSPAASEPAYAQRLRERVATAVPKLRAISDDASGRPRAPGKWSPREIIGHLVDSASNNHQRFVRATWQDDLVFPGYEQDEWVRLQDYQHAPWSELVTLWAAFNNHMARLMGAIPEDVRTRERTRHNLDDLAWRPVPASQPVTLDYFMEDYVGHLEHHLRQILGDG